MEKISLKEFRSLAPYWKPYAAHYFAGFLCLIVVDAAQIFIPQCISRAIDMFTAWKFTADAPPPDMRAVYMLSGAIIALAFIIFAGRLLWRYFIHGASRRIEAAVRVRLFEHLLTLSYDFYQKNKIGDLMARATNDLNAVRMAIGLGFVAFIDSTAMTAAILIIMFSQDSKTAAIAVLPLLFVTVLILIFGKAVGKLFGRAQETYSKMSDAVQETFAGIRVVKSFVQENWFIRKFADTNDDYKKANMTLVKIFGVFFPLITFLSGLTMLALLLVGGAKVMRGQMSAGEFAAFLNYLHMLIWPMLGMGFMVNMMQRGAASLARINEIFNTKPSIDSPAFDSSSSGDSAAAAESSHEKLDAQTAISVRNLSLLYANSEKTELSGVNLEIREGMFVGILGKTGAGKTTLLKTFMRLVDPPPASVFVYGRDVQSYNLAELRALFAVVPQDTYLFSDSIKRNIAYGMPESMTGTSAESSESIDAILSKAADISAISRDLADFQDGWNTVVGERGMSLSGGQKQRVAIARALARTGGVKDSGGVKSQADILVLDDALSAVDTETEQRILSHLLETRRNKTTIIVSHRVSTLQNTDFVIVLEDGKIVESGSPKELMQNDGFFAKTAHAQGLE